MSSFNSDESVSILECISDAAIMTDKDYCVVYWNIGAESLYNIPADQALGKPLEKLIDVPAEIQDRYEVRRFVEQDGKWRGSAVHHSKNGEPIWVDWSVSSCNLENGQKGRLILSRDISRHKEQSKRTDHLNSVLKAIRNVNQLITKENNPDELIRRACECLTETLGYFNAWIVRFDVNKKVVAAAQSKLDGNFDTLLERMKVGDFTSCAKRAMAGESMVAVNDPHSECHDCPLAEMYKGRAAYSAGLNINGKLYGILSVSVPAEYAENEEEKALFQELADDLGFAMYRLEMEDIKSHQQEKLKEAMQAIEDSPLLVFNWKNDEGWPVEFVSSNVKSVLGYTPETFLSGEISYADLIHPDDLERVIQEVTSASNDKTVSQFVHEPYRIKDAKGKMLYLHDSTYINRDENGEATGFRGVILDISSEKNLEKGLLRSKQRERSFFRYSPKLLSEISTDGRYLRVNKALAEYFNSTPSFFEGAKFKDLLDKETANLFSQRIEEILERKTPLLVEDSLVLKGERRYFSTVLFPMFDENGEVESIGSIAEDITESKLADERIQSALDNATAKTRELEVLLESSKLVLENNDFQTTARKIFDSARQMTGTQSGYVALLSDSGEENEVLFLESGGLPCSVDPNLPMPVRGLRAEAYKSGNVAFDNDFMKSPWADFMPAGHVDLRNVMFSPLNIEGKTVGIMGLANKDGDFTKNDQHMAAALGQIAAMALQNSRNMNALLESEKKLIFSEKRSRALVDNSPVCHKVIDLDFNLQYMSANGFKMLKLEENNEYYGKPYPFDFFPEPSREALKEGLLKVKTSGEIETMELLSNDIEGNVVWLHHSIIPVFSDDGTIDFITIVSADITEYKKMTEEILHQQNELELTLEATSDAIWSWDFKDNQLFFSPSYYTMLGYEPNEFPATYENWVKLIHPDDVEHALATAERYLKNKPSIYQNEFRLLAKDGTYRWILTKASVSTRDENGEAIRLIGNHQDITERKLIEQQRQQVEDQLQQAQKMESVGRLAGGVAHDFNNLLTGITGNVSLALMDLPQADPLRETLEEINQAADSAATLTRQLLAFSRKQLISPKVLDLNRTIDNSYKMLRRLIGEDIDLVFHPEKKLGLAKVDPGQLEQILINLAVNARDAMPNGGKLILETDNVTLDETYSSLHAHVTPGEYVMIAVSDNGFGMDEEVRTHLFEPFFTTKPKDKGTGLGLATVYGAVKQNEGNIEVYSEPGEGTTFKIYFPKIESEVDTIKKNETWDELPKGTETVLVVEDERMVRNIAVKILTRQGYKVIQAEDGPSALHMVSVDNLKIDLLMTDIIMPNMNGRQLAEKLHVDYPGLKVLYTSGYTENVIAHHGVLEEGVNFIGKPYTPQGLAKKVREVMEM